MKRSLADMSLLDTKEIEIDDGYCASLIQKNDTCAINSIDCNKISYQDFFNNYMLKNTPCIIRNVSTAWSCSTNWIYEEKINTDYFEKEFKNVTAPVADCDAITFNSQCKTDMKVKEYMEYLKSDEKKQLLYLKDWHLKKAQPQYDFYTVPLIFASDWLNEYSLDQQEDDFMFVYIGPKDSWTPLHVDVYNSYSWSVNVIGRKKWILFPPEEENKLKDCLGNLPLLFDSKSNNDIVFYEIIQEKGDAIFVPSGWHHQVVNMLDTISVNHNWINGCNIQIVWKALQECLKSVEHEIVEFKNTPEYASQCQIILKSLFGMNYEFFIIFLSHIAKKRLSQLNGRIYLNFQRYTLGTNHIIFDLRIIQSVMRDIINIPNFFEKYLITSLQCDFNATWNSINKYILCK